MFTMSDYSVVESDGPVTLMVQAVTTGSPEMEGVVTVTASDGTEGNPLSISTAFWKDV